MKSKLTIEINTTNLKKNIIDGEDYTSEQDNEFHRAIFDVIENFVTSEEFEPEVLETLMDTAEFTNPKIKEFLDVGSISIVLHQEKGE